MLSVPAGEVGDPMLFIILMEADNGLVHMRATQSKDADRGP